MDAIPWDFDQDGLTDLLVLSSWGSGLHRDEVSVFNRRTKESKVIAEVFDEEYIHNGLFDLCFDDGPYEVDGALNINVYEANDMVERDDYVRYTKAGLHGTIRLVDGQPVYIRK